MGQGHRTIEFLEGWHDFTAVVGETVFERLLQVDLKAGDACVATARFAAP
jgi:hypothetical protein